VIHGLGMAACAGSLNLLLALEARQDEKSYASCELLPFVCALDEFGGRRSMKGCAVEDQKKDKKIRRCTSRESNPGLYRGRVLFYH
jgi:hypothetical protein